MLAQNRELAAAMARLDKLTDWERRPRKTMRVGLEPMLDLAARLRDPQKAFRAVHVAGTKGKGSVSALIEAALVHAGLKVGRYGSPHVERVSERVNLQGRDVDDATLARALTRGLDAYEAARREQSAAAEATWFDLLTSAAFLIFRDAGVDWAVVEVGLGGRLELDQYRLRRSRRRDQHRARAYRDLGKTRAAIAGEKVGILKQGAVLVTTLPPGDEAGRVLQARADALGSGSPALTRRAGDNRRDQCRDRRPRSRSAREERRPSGLRRADRRGADRPKTRAAARLVGRMERVGMNRGLRAFPWCSTARMSRSTSPRCCAISPATPILQGHASRSSRLRPTRTQRLPGGPREARVLDRADRRSLRQPRPSRRRPCGRRQRLGFQSEVEPDPQRAFIAASNWRERRTHGCW